MKGLNMRFKLVLPRTSNKPKREASIGSSVKGRIYRSQWNFFPWRGDRQNAAPLELERTRPLEVEPAPSGGAFMNKSIIGFAVAAGALFTTAAGAAPLTTSQSIAPDSNIQNVRMICNEDGRCWRERDRRVIIRDSYDYGPRDRYIDRRDYRDYEDRGGIGFRAPGVSVGIGTDRY
jgi:hypothetical protein